METVTFLGKQKSAKTFIDQHNFYIQKELTFYSFGGEKTIIFVISLILGQLKVRMKFWCLQIFQKVNHFFD